jgi:hypothetical protein
MKKKFSLLGKKSGRHGTVGRQYLFPKLLKVSGKTIFWISVQFAESEYIIRNAMHISRICLEFCYGIFASSCRIVHSYKNLFESVFEILRIRAVYVCQ